MIVENTLYEGCSKLVSGLQMRYSDWEGSRQFEGTVDRLYRLYEEFCWTPEKIEEEVHKSFKSFEQSFEEMVVVGPAEVVLLCPHHLMPCALQVITGYIPNGEGRVLGLSKFVRLADIIGRRPILQEQYCKELADTLEKGLEPKGVAVYAVGIHGCMAFRGVKQRSKVITSIVKGDFKTEPETRHEFLSLAQALREVY